MGEAHRSNEDEATTAAFVAIENRLRAFGVNKPIVAAGLAIVALRDLPVEQRMEAMGMRPMVDPETGSADFGWWEEDRG